MRAVKKRQRARFGPWVSLLIPFVDVSKTAVLGTEKDKVRGRGPGQGTDFPL